MRCLWYLKTLRGFARFSGPHSGLKWRVCISSGNRLNEGGTTTFARPSKITQTVTPSRAFLRSEEHTSELQSRQYLVCRLLLEKKNHQPRSISRGPRRMLEQFCSACWL